MLDNIIRFLQRIKNDTGITNLSETDAKSGIIEPILRMLGWDFAVFSNEIEFDTQI